MSWTTSLPGREIPQGVRSPCTHRHTPNTHTYIQYLVRTEWLSCPCPTVDRRDHLFSLSGKEIEVDGPLLRPEEVDDRSCTLEKRR